MRNKLLLFFTLCISTYGISQDCPDLLDPLDGATNVPVDATISWEVVDGIPSYGILLGTTPGGNDIADALVGSATSYTPPQGLPENTTIFVTIILDFFQGQSDIFCEGQFFTTEDVTTPPDCTDIRIPADGATDVSVFANIVWNYAPTATSYDVIVGTAPGLGDIANINVTGLNFDPPGELPENSVIYVQIIPRNENGTATNCTEFSFTTREPAPLPDCTGMIQPADGEIDVALTPLLEWAPVPGATGYKVTIGTTPTARDVLDEAVFFTNSTFVIDFEPNRTFFITITPFNDSGDAIGCGQETFSTLVGCNPFFDPNVGEFVTPNPNLEFPGNFTFCENFEPLSLTAPEGADGYRWGRLDAIGNPTIIVEGADVTIDEPGNYFLEAYNNVSASGSTIECPTILDFSVVSSEIATINNLDIRDTASGLDITVEISGVGDYEFAIGNIDGPYQDSNILRGVPPGNRTVYVRDKNGCGIAQETFEQNLTVEGFPKFFTPNGDNVNDFWQFVQPEEGENIVLESIRIYDRFGTFLREINQNSLGWDGTFNGRQLPSGSYWFKAIDDQNRMVQGFFALKR
ncbi:MAG: T9SS type B sorting domain-containing protein [Bacteroidota bacterium]